jgi:ABC-type uncharacterized transport system substrate-binding protein
MDRRGFIGTLAGGLLFAPLAAQAQQAGTVFRIGVLGAFPPTTDPEDARLWQGFLQGLRDLGYVESQNVVIVGRYSEGRNERLPALAADLVRLKVDVILAGAGTPGASAAQRATSTIPIVMTIPGDPVGSGLVASLARPGRNVTGLSTVAPDLVAKQMQLLKEVVPTMSRVAVLSNPTNPSHATSLKEAEVAARSLRVQLQSLRARAAGELDSVFVAAAKESANALIVIGDGIFFGQRARIAELTAKSHLPSIFMEREHASAGGLMAYGPDFLDNMRRAAYYVDKILKGAKPGDLPIEQPVKFQLVINLKTARALGLTIPPSLLQRADQVIE